MNFLADVRFGWRMLARSPAFTLAAVAAMALGIGVNSMMFTIYNAALFKGLPFERSEEVVHIHSRNLAEVWDGRGFYYEDFLDYRERATLFTGLAAFMDGGYRMADATGTVQEIPGCLVTPSLFSLLGLRPLMGRDFQTADAEPGAPPVVMLSYGLWQATFGGDPGVVGRQLRLDTQNRTIIGVMPRGLEFPRNSRLWTPIVDTPQNRESWYLRFGFYLVGRLKDATQLRRAEAELRGIAAQIGASRPPTQKGIEPVVLPYVEWEVRPKDRLMAMTAMGASTFVLLIACTNVANLLLSRAGHRRREVAIRIAVGATRLRIAGQLLIESVLLGFLGGGLGVFLALALVRAFVLAIQPMGVPYWIDWSMDSTSLLYLATICVVSGVLFGLAPALHISAVNVSEGIQEGGRQTQGSRPGVLTGGLVVAEISLTLVLMVGAGLMIRSLLAMQAVNLGLDTRNLLSMTVPLGDAQYPEPVQRNAFVDRLFESLRSHPDLETLAVASSIPAGGASVARLSIEGRDGGGSDPVPVAHVSVGEGYFQALGLKMARGREFTEADSLGGIASAIVNERFASQYFPGVDPVGKRIRIDPGPFRHGPWRTVVGVGPPIRQTSLRGAVEPLLYVPFREGPPFHFQVLARSRSSGNSVARAFREEVRRLDPDLPSPRIRSMDEYLEQLSLETRILGKLFSVFAIFGLFLSTLGIYAVTAYATSRRTREIGIRIALGATRADIVRLVLRTGAAQLAAALPIGLGAALAVSRVFESVLFEVASLDPATFILIPLGLSAITLFACFIPARKAARLDPVEALRTE